MKTLRTLAVLLLILSCSKEEEDCDCFEKTLDSEVYRIKTCSEENTKGLEAKEITRHDYWRHYEKDYPCD